MIKVTFFGTTTLLFDDGKDQILFDAHFTRPHIQKFFKKEPVSIITYAAATMFGGFCPIAAYIVVALVSAWWIFPERKKDEPKTD